MKRSLQLMHRLITFVTNDKVHFGLTGRTITCAEHIMTITPSDKKYFAGGVNTHDENVFGVINETFGMLNLTRAS